MLRDSMGALAVPYLFWSSSRLRPVRLQVTNTAHLANHLEILA